MSGNSFCFLIPGEFWSTCPTLFQLMWSFFFCYSMLFLLSKDKLITNVLFLWLFLPEFVSTIDCQYLKDRSDCALFKIAFVFAWGGLSIHCCWIIAVLFHDLVSVFVEVVSISTVDKSELSFLRDISSLLVGFLQTTYC